MNIETIINLVQEAKQAYVNSRNTDPTAKEQLLHLYNELMVQIQDIDALVQELVYNLLQHIVYKQNQYAITV